ncbi:protein translocase subunit SecD [Microlunatus parietis]|uniref:Protein translocase subunit SecD n=1 Tax=Microlunatus parietis TaxID=682979 RepID=A0A7Y9I342_9ACTN|nr:protein translocase subunit SecD [Microlunatus parietis]NYE69141.1 preprotein translocase subunit SecD [Microlunatus parietis]
MASNSGHPGRILIVFAVLVAALFGIMAINQTWTPKLGLDLRGGTTITLTASNLTGGGAVSEESLNLAQTIIQNRVDSLGVGETEVTTANGNQITVSVPNVQQDELVRLVGQTAVLRFRAVYAAEQVTPPAPDPTPTPTPSSSETPAPSGSPSPSASTSPTASPTGNGRPAPQLPTAPPPPKTPRPSEPGKGTPEDQGLTWQPSQNDQAEFAGYQCGDEFPDVADQPLMTCNREKTEKYLLGPTLITGDKLTTASAGIPQNDVRWVVNLQFNDEGTRQFAAVTKSLSTQSEPNNRFAIVLDGQVISAPTTVSIPDGRAQIEGSFTQATATELANILKYGALPLAFEVSSVDNVSATLGGEQLQAGIIAGIIGLILVMAFALIYYRGLAIVVLASLVVAAAITYAFMVLLGSSVGFALNLPGIAGAIVAIGVTADSFVIYFERIRDEVRDGRSLRTSVETGWLRARQTVLIADAVSMLSAIILFILAIGAVKGFAFTLGLTTLIDVAVVFLFTKPLMSVLARTKFFGGGHKLSGLDPAHLGVAALPGSRGRRRTVKVGDPAPKEA